MQLPTVMCPCGCCKPNLTTHCLPYCRKLQVSPTFLNLKLEMRGSPAPTQVQHTTSAACRISRSVACLRALYLRSSWLLSSPCSSFSCCSLRRSALSGISTCRTCKQESALQRHPVHSVDWLNSACSSVWRPCSAMCSITYLSRTTRLECFVWDCLSMHHDVHHDTPEDGLCRRPGSIQAIV